VFRFGEHWYRAIRLLALSCGRDGWGFDSGSYRPVRFGGLLGGGQLWVGRFRGCTDRRFRVPATSTCADAKRGSLHHRDWCDPGDDILKHDRAVHSAAAGSSIGSVDVSGDISLGGVTGMSFFRHGQPFLVRSHPMRAATVTKIRIASLLPIFVRGVCEVIGGIL